MRPNYFLFLLVESFKFSLAQDLDLTGLLQLQSLTDVSSGEQKLGDTSFHYSIQLVTLP